MILRAVTSLLEVPRVPDPPARVWRDWVLVVAFVVTALLEGLLRSDIAWRPAVLTMTVLIAPTLLFRRTHPLGALAAAFVPVLVLTTLGLVAGVDEYLGLNATAFVLVLPYALTRWGSGRDVLLGTSLIVVSAVVGMLQDPATTLGDVVGGLVVVTLTELLGVTVRMSATARDRGREQVRLQEREQLARELHDTVAHHITAIVVRAQAGRVVAATNPSAAVDALSVIEDEASRTLAELRFLVGALRDTDDLAPSPGIADLTRLARSTVAGPAVELEVSGRLDDLSVTTGNAVYRIAQEAVTNALRHARHATRIVVRVAGEDECVRVSVVDDGQPGAVTATTGYGVVGMSERASALGGTLEAGPEPGRGWAVRAELPRAVRVP